MPCLMLNYFGQGAMLLQNPAAAVNPFYLMVPEPLLIPMVLLATCATVIASQAVISGAFSLTSQAIQLGFVPRMRIRYTSAAEIGQIYLPVINWILLALVIARGDLVQEIGKPGRGLRHCRDHDDADHPGPGRLHDAQRLEVEPGAGGPAGRRSSCWWT